MPDASPADHEGLLRAALVRVFERLDALTLSDDAPAPGPSAVQPAGALDALASRFDLSSFERDLVLLCAGVSLDASLAAACARLSSTRRAVASFDVAAALFGAADWRALSPSGPLRAWGILTVDASEDCLAAAPLALDESTLLYLLGRPSLDPRLLPLVRPADASTLDDVIPSHHAVVTAITALLTREARDARPPLVHLYGASWATAAVAAAACAARGVPLYTLHAGAMPESADARALLARSWARYARLTDAALLLDDAAPSPEGRADPYTWLDALDATAFACARAPLPRGGRRVPTRYTLPPSSYVEQRALWARALPTSLALGDDALDEAAMQFELSPQEVVSVAERAARGAGDVDPGRRLREACRAQVRVHMEGLAQRVESPLTWGDLVLPPQQAQTLAELRAHVRHRYTVHETWALGRAGGRGLGVAALFAGQSGTGKTTAAEALASDLDLDLYRVDLSALMSKYIGETEKNLRRVFDAAEAGGCVLLFDEADALFGKRSEVRDSHDRYANLEVSYLLQRIETFRGLAILTTNLKGALDGAFLRRLRFVIDFPFPDAAQRAELWRRSLPATVPTEGVEVERLAQLQLTGGIIRNVALHAAFLAADARSPVRMAHVLQAARRECAKLGRPLTEAEARWCTAP